MADLGLLDLLFVLVPKSISQCTYSVFCKIWSYYAVSRVQVVHIDHTKSDITNQYDVIINDNMYTENYHEYMQDLYRIITSRYVAIPRSSVNIPHKMWCIYALYTLFYTQSPPLGCPMERIHLPQSLWSDISWLITQLSSSHTTTPTNYPFHIPTASASSSSHHHHHSTTGASSNTSSSLSQRPLPAHEEALGCLFNLVQSNAFIFTSAYTISSYSYILPESIILRDPLEYNDIYNHTNVDTNAHTQHHDNRDTTTTTTTTNDDDDDYTDHGNKNKTKASKKNSSSSILSHHLVSLPHVNSADPHINQIISLTVLPSSKYMHNDNDIYNTSEMLDHLNLSRSYYYDNRKSRNILIQYYNNMFVLPHSHYNKTKRQYNHHHHHQSSSTRSSSLSLSTYTRLNIDSYSSWWYNMHGILMYPQYKHPLWHIQSYKELYEYNMMLIQHKKARSMYSLYHNNNTNNTSSINNTTNNNNNNTPPGVPTYNDTAHIVSTTLTHYNRMISTRTSYSYPLVALQVPQKLFQSSLVTEKVSLSLNITPEGYDHELRSVCNDYTASLFDLMLDWGTRSSIQSSQCDSSMHDNDTTTTTTTNHHQLNVPVLDPLLAPSGQIDPSSSNLSQQKQQQQQKQTQSMPLSDKLITIDKYLYVLSLFPAHSMILAHNIFPALYTVFPGINWITSLAKMATKNSNTTSNRSRTSLSRKQQHHSNTNSSTVSSSSSSHQQQQQQSLHGESSIQAYKTMYHYLSQILGIENKSSHNDHDASPNQAALDAPHTESHLTLSLFPLLVEHTLSLLVSTLDKHDYQARYNQSIKRVLAAPITTSHYLSAVGLQSGAFFLTLLNHRRARDEAMDQINASKKRQPT